MTPEKLEDWEKITLAAIKLLSMDYSIGGFYNPSDYGIPGNPEKKSKKMERPEPRKPSYKKRSFGEE